MCVAQIGRVTAVTEDTATVEVDGRIRTVSRILVPEAAAGDWVTVGAGWILERLDSIEAGQLLALYQAVDPSLEGAAAGADGGTP